LTIPSNYLEIYVSAYQEFLGLLSYTAGRPVYPARLIQEVRGPRIKKSLKQQPLLEANSKRGPLATGIPLPFLLYLLTE
jgi:hypothetical protein